MNGITIQGDIYYKGDIYSLQETQKEKIKRQVIMLEAWGSS